MITIKTKKEIDLISKASIIVYNTHKYLNKFIKPGITTKELEILAEKFIIDNDGIPATKGYNGYPAAVCISVNEEVVHGIPSEKQLKNGDIVTIDIVVCYKGYYGDSAWTYPVGNINNDNKKLLEHTEKALYEGISMVKPGNRIGDISAQISSYAKKHRLGVVKELVGHGIGLHMHEDPDVPNFGIKGTGPVLKPGMVIAIEPMLNLGSPKVYLLDDEWTVVTADFKPSAHFEHTVVVTDDGFRILTKG